MDNKYKEGSVAEGDSEDQKLSNSQNDEITVGITRYDFRYFIGDNADKYLEKFRKFYVNGRDKFAVTWHWPAFFFPFVWLAYRKLYGLAIIIFLVSFVPVLNIILGSLTFGLIGNYLYYRHTKKKILQLKATQTSSDSYQILDALRKIGGVNKPAALVAAIGFALQGIAIWFERAQY